MNIRIGNDVRVKIPISVFGNINPTDIKFTQCAFVKKKKHFGHPDCGFEVGPLPIHHWSAYTIHGCGIPEYNVKPVNSVGFAMHQNPHSHGFYFCECDHHYVGKPHEGMYMHKCKIEGNNLVAYFPAEAQCEEGQYDCYFDIKVLEKGWDCDNLHSYRASYPNCFKLTYETTGTIGFVEINPQEHRTVDTYVFGKTDAELKQLNGNYSSIIGNVDGFNLNESDNQSKDIQLIGNSNRMVILSTYPTINVKFNDFPFPMDMYRLDNGYYMYVSKYTYSNQTVKVKILDSGISNNVNTNNPYITQDSSENTPGGSDQDDPSGADIYNYIKNNTLYVTGTNQPGNLKVFGRTSNSALYL